MLDKEDIQNFRNYTKYIPTAKDLINLRDMLDKQVVQTLEN